MLYGIIGGVVAAAIFFILLLNPKSLKFRKERADIGKERETNSQPSMNLISTEKRKD
jgi:hypothetical protein